MCCNSKKRNKQTFVNIDVLVIDPYFCHQIAWHWMECRTGESVLFDLYTSSPDWCCQPYEVFQCNKNICDFYAKAMFTTERCLLVLTVYRITFTEKHIATVDFVKVRNKALNKSREKFVRNIFLIEQILELLRPFVFLLRHGYCVLKNIKSIIGLVMSKGNKWNFKSCFISKLWHRNLGKERNFSVAEEWTKL